MTFVFEWTSDKHHHCAPAALSVAAFLLAAFPHLSTLLQNHRACATRIPWTSTCPRSTSCRQGEGIWIRAKLKFELPLPLSNSPQVQGYLRFAKLKRTQHVREAIAVITEFKDERLTPGVRPQRGSIRSKICTFLTPPCGARRALACRRCTTTTTSRLCSRTCRPP